MLQDHTMHSLISPHAHFHACGHVYSICPGHPFKRAIRKPLEVYQLCGSQHQCVHCAFKTPLKKIRHIPFHFPPDNDFLYFSFQITVVCRHILWDYLSVMFFSHSSQRTLRASKIKIQQRVLHLKSTAKVALQK